MPTGSFLLHHEHLKEFYLFVALWWSPCNPCLSFLCSHTGCRVAVPPNPGAGLTRQDAVIFDWDAVGNEGVNPSRHAAFQGTSSMSALATRGVRVLVK
jgi:hypothetical protein